MADSNATSKVPAIHDKGAHEIRYTCKCGAVNHIENPDPFELLSLYQDSMWAVCEKCGAENALGLNEVITDDR